MKHTLLDKDIQEKRTMKSVWFNKTMVSLLREKVTVTKVEGCLIKTAMFFFFNRTPWVLILLRTNHNILKEITAPSLIKAVSQIQHSALEVKSHMHYLICMKVYECVNQMNKNASPLAAAGPLSCKATFCSITRFAGTEDG